MSCSRLTVLFSVLITAAWVSSCADSSIDVNKNDAGTDTDTDTDTNTDTDTDTDTDLSLIHI